MANDNWTDEQCRFFFLLLRDEKIKGNKTKTGLNSTAREFIIKKFEEKFGEKHIWDRFKNKIDTCRRTYNKVKKLTHNRTGVGYDEMGRFDMSDDWWNERITEWAEAKKFKEKLLPNIDLFEEEFGAVHVSGAEGWSAQQGEASLDSRVGENEADSIDIDVPPPVVERQSKAGSSGSKRKRKEVDQVTESYVARSAILEQKNRLMEEMMEMMKRDYSYSVERVLDILHELPGVRKWSAFYCASVDHLIADAANRQGFIAYSRAEDKITYLEHRTGKHSGLRSVIERTFGVWKAKWRILDRKHPKYDLPKWIKIVTATMALHNFIRGSHQEDCDFVHWQGTEAYHAHGDEEAGEDDDSSSDDDHGGHAPYEPRGDRAMEDLRDIITAEIARGRRLPY